MGYFQHIQSAATASAGNAVSGSIIKIQALHGAGNEAEAATDLSTSSLAEVQYGNFTFNHPNSLNEKPTITASIDQKITGLIEGPIHLNAGESIEGPIISFNLSATSNSVLVYSNMPHGVMVSKSIGGWDSGIG